MEGMFCVISRDWDLGLGRSRFRRSREIGGVVWVSLSFLVGILGRWLEIVMNGFRWSDAHFDGTRVLRSFIDGERVSVARLNQRGVLKPRSSEQRTFSTCLFRVILDRRRDARVGMSRYRRRGVDTRRETHVE